jgi:hypothetical protein
MNNSWENLTLKKLRNLLEEEFSFGNKPQLYGESEVTGIIHTF